MVGQDSSVRLNPDLSEKLHETHVGIDRTIILCRKNFPPIDNLSQSPGTILPNFDAHIDVVGSEGRALRRWWIIVNMSVKVDPSRFKENNRTV